MSLNTLIIRKNNHTYETKIIEYLIPEAKIKLKIINSDSRSIFLYAKDKVDVGIPQKGGFCHFKSIVLYHDVIDHFVTIEYPQNILKEERRKFKRLYIHININIHSDNQTENIKQENEVKNLMTVIMCNISMGGLAFYSIEEFKVGETVIFDFSLPNDISFKNLEGTIKFSAPTKYDNVKEYGVQFLNILDGHREALKDFIFNYISSQPSTAED